MYVRIGVIVVTFGRIIDRKKLIAVRFGREERGDPC
jgi:hypothetical protein